MSDPVGAEGGQDMEAQEALVLGPGRVFEVAPGLQPLAGVVAEELFAETGVDPHAAAGVGLLVGQPGVGVCLGGKGRRGANPAALGLVAGPVALTPFLDAAEDAPSLGSTLTVLGRNGKNEL